MTTHKDMALDAIDTEFMQVLEWVDYEVLAAQIKHIYLAKQKGDEKSASLFTKSLCVEIENASYKYTEAEYEASQGELVTTTWANRQSAMRDVGHSAKDFA